MSRPSRYILLAMVLFAGAPRGASADPQLTALLNRLKSPVPPSFSMNGPHSFEYDGEDIVKVTTKHKDGRKTDRYYDISYFGEVRPVKTRTRNGRTILLKKGEKPVFATTKSLYIDGKAFRMTFYTRGRALLGAKWHRNRKYRKATALKPDQSFGCPGITARKLWQSRRTLSRVRPVRPR